MSVHILKLGDLFKGGTLKQANFAQQWGRDSGDRNLATREIEIRDVSEVETVTEIESWTVTTTETDNTHHHSGPASDNSTFELNARSCHHHYIS